ncbi:MAG: hypothetical protein IIX50_06220, partial [Bacteroidaceae bacterium]|nr:hypothetical protein [Bacteroidaceae bacterium]
YVHRIGRTARAGADGCAITFVAVDDQSRFAAIEEFIGREVHKLPLPEGLGDAPEYAPKKKKKSNGRGKGSRGRGGKGNHRGGKGRGNSNGNSNAQAPNGAQASNDGQSKSHSKRRHGNKKKDNAPKS